MKLIQPRSCMSVITECGLSSFFLFSGISVIIFIICEYLRQGTEYTKCYKSNKDIYNLLRGAMGLDIFFLCGFYIINFFNVCCSCYKPLVKTELPRYQIKPKPVQNPAKSIQNIDYDEDDDEIEAVEEYQDNDFRVDFNNNK
eukprot:gene7963-9796_t